MKKKMCPRMARNLKMRPRVDKKFEKCDLERTKISRNGI